MRVRVRILANPRKRVVQDSCLVTTPPPVPRHPPARKPTARPGRLVRLWNELKPPPAVDGTEGISEETKLRHRKVGLAIASLVVVVAGAGAWGVYQYVASAPTRADAAFQEGMLRMGAGDYKGAVERFTKAVDILPRMAAGYF